MNSNADAFLDHFCLELAFDEKVKQDAYKLRHDVYVKEFGFEDIAGDVEKDDYDDRSLSCVIYHVKTGKAAACIRVIPAEQTLLPVEKYCSEYLFHDRFSIIANDRSRMCEISRLAVAKEFRKRPKEFLSPIGSPDGEERTFPLLSAACFLSAMIVSFLYDTPNGIAVMETFLPRITKRVGIEFETIGNELNYHGLRTPYFVTYGNIMDKLQDDYKRLMSNLELDISNQIIQIW